MAGGAPKVEDMSSGEGGGGFGGEGGGAVAGAPGVEFLSCQSLKS